MRQKLFQRQRDVSSINKTRPIVSISYDRRETFTLCHSSNVRPLSLSSVIFEALRRYRFPSMKYTSDIDTPVTSAGSLGSFLSTILRIYGKGWRVVMRRRKYVSTDKARETELPHCRHWIFFLPSCSLIFLAFPRRYLTRVTQRLKKNQTSDFLVSRSRHEIISQTQGSQSV